MFSLILNVVGSLFHFYVAARLRRVEPLRRRVGARAWWVGVIVLWVLYLAGVRIGDEELDWRWWPGQFAMMWLGITFLMTMCLLLADLLTGFGWWVRRRVASTALGIAAVGGVLLCAFAIFQAARAPVVSTHEVVLEALPAELDGTVLVAMTDLHLGAQRGARWMAGRVEQVNALSPDVVVMVGDQVEGRPTGEDRLPAALGGIRAPLGTWAVTGNHDFHGDLAATLAEFEAGGVRWLRDGSVELAPGLVLSGIDDIGRWMRQGGDYAAGLGEVLDRRPPGASILLSHTPAPGLVERAAEKGVDLMLAGHTHGGQIWPFGHLVARQFPPVVGEHQVGGMTLLISHGAGSWGPRMRLWHPGEIHRMVLRSPG
ncbi:metallophosphoesterase [Novilysobacter defluvii]|uniref:Calcineurin-like phosphoesterase domain-containing protein n=1 Tax=Lysobacter defluvii IMMIB APB-9 = DSM 18482 TaxID=1385515 RepID=A0A0A0M6F2_9GAMM|nr:metallophosphoesterase [Lysobacter defluvii]KGO98568.1 hypothetical protein N791_01170 [Lysobacter defluvii IMMIB APB-9 = DSM 18482]